MKFFKRKTSSVRKGTFSAKLNENVVRHQHRIADYLNERTKLLSGKAQLFFLILFCIVFGTYCLYLISSAIN